MRTLASTPSLRFEAVRPRADRSVLRSDIAGFIGRTHRGPIDRVVRVEGWREYQLHFGGLDEDARMSYALHGYFENGGQIAHIRRVTRDAEVAWADWIVAKDSTNMLVRAIPLVEPESPKLTAQGCSVVKILATSPGVWAKGLWVKIGFLRLTNGSLRFDFQVRTKHGERERFQIVVKSMTEDSDPLDSAWGDFDRLVAAKSGLIRVKNTDSGFHRARLSSDVSKFCWDEIKLDLSSQADDSTTRDASSMIDQEYDNALLELMEEPEVALVAFPEYECSVSNPHEYLAKSTKLAAQTQDRMVIADVPDELTLMALNQATASHENRFERRCLALYEPRLRVNDSTGSRTLSISATGHVAGAMSRVDRERGAHHTPANVALLDAVDLAELHGQVEQDDALSAHINQIRCTAGRGLVIWGGRTVDESTDGRFIAHRRFIHRLIRAIRRVAEPIVFETNSPELRRMLTRAVTTVLLEAYRGGALLGERPDEAFFVTCDDSNNPYAERELGRVTCEIGLALAAPMEFITIRVLLSQEGNLEVFES